VSEAHIVRQTAICPNAPTQDCTGYGKK